MKTLRFMAMLAMASAVSCSFMSCGDDDDDFKAPDNQEMTSGSEGAEATDGAAGTGILSVEGQQVKISQAKFVAHYNEQANLSHNELLLSTNYFRSVTRAEADCNLLLMFTSEGRSEGMPVGTFDFTAQGNLNGNFISANTNNAGCGTLDISKQDDRYTVRILNFNGVKTDSINNMQSFTTEFIFEGTVQDDTYYPEEPGTMPSDSTATPTDSIYTPWPTQPSDSTAYNPGWSEEPADTTCYPSYPGATPADSTSAPADSIW